MDYNSKIGKFTQKLNLVSKLKCFKIRNLYKLGQI